MASTLAPKASAFPLQTKEVGHALQRGQDAENTATNSTKVGSKSSAYYRDPETAAARALEQPAWSKNSFYMFKTSQ